MKRKDETRNKWEKIVKKGFSNYEKLDINERIWFNIESITTGGLIDHYVNYGAEHNSDLLDDLMYLKHDDIADLFKEINNLFDKNSPPIDIEKRNKEIAKWDEMKNNLLEKNERIFWEKSELLENSLLQHIANKILNFFVWFALSITNFVIVS